MEMRAGKRWLMMAVPAFALMIAPLAYADLYYPHSPVLYFIALFVMLMVIFGLYWVAWKTIKATPEEKQAMLNDFNRIIAEKKGLAEKKNSAS